MITTNFKTPILFIIFNRPDTTQKVFDEIKKIKPKYLFVAADGARNEDEKYICHATRDIINQVDWDCELKTLFQDKNLGCKIGVSTAINWFFENVEQGIILEDDCLPSPSFFTFCETLLEKYKDNNNIMHISGTNINIKIDSYPNSYYFSNFPLIWGWATWKRAWKTYDVNLNRYPEFKKQNKIKEIFTSKIIQLHWLHIFERIFLNKIDTWDYQWTFNLWNHKGLSIIPNKNLITNIGFDERGTHTRSSESILANIPLEEIKEIIHINKLDIDKNNEYRIFKSMTNLETSFNYNTTKYVLKILMPDNFKNYLKKFRF